MRRVSLLLLIALPAFAEESGATKEPGMIWVVLNFILLAGLIGWLVSKHGAPLLAARGKAISEALAAGTRAKEEADARAAEVSKKLANLGQEIAVLRTSAQEERVREEDRIRRETQAEIVRIQHQASMDVESAGKQARLEVQRTAAALAIGLAEQKVRARMSLDVQSSLLQNFLKDLADGHARAGAAD